MRAVADRSLGIATSGSASTDPATPVHVVISHAEINDQHGTGPLVRRVFSERPAIFSLHFRDDWKIHDFGDWHVRLPLKVYTQDEMRAAIQRLLYGRNIKTV